MPDRGARLRDVRRKGQVAEVRALAQHLGRRRVDLHVLVGRRPAIERRALRERDEQRPFAREAERRGFERAALDRVRGLLGTTVLGNGRPLLVLDPRGLAEMAGVHKGAALRAVRLPSRGAA
ncbi:MAG: hypothetical protein NVSMB59_24040 [Vulcanimicrobiaceae bacterium]